ncbi:NYN domain-containing protein [Desulfovibrio psychrotolerans]|uniref:NYN domain-containing protein n=1 Tax=Desulfovibrio psychrotolerans TaxID=415242 RepID=A0A7J0BRA5_9BACT|nr:NYN domain-containing protein [Desulfovibrio psychrotolerans]GFM36246.1 NYN domain-containing protein [Desulfovibrio psychrotolerans]
MERRQSRVTSFDEVYTALFVDFDNIFTRLEELSPAAARSFATNPQRWLRWLETHAVRMLYGDGVRRRILKRCCYLNPHCYHQYRPFFIRAAFNVIDCPPLTNQGKTSADIHLVMDAMDTLNHKTQFDEFIILSGDADFTPLLIRLQEHARRTLVLSVGYASPAYTAASSWRIREDWFVQQALEDRPMDEYQPPLSTSARIVRPASRSESGHMERGAQIVKRMVSESSTPVPLAQLSHTLQKELDAAQDWFGFGRFRDYLEALELDRLEVSSVVPGYVYDPARHEEPEETSARTEFKERYPELYDFALRVHRLTDVPLLMPEHYRDVLGFIVEEVNENGFFLTNTSRSVRDKCVERGVPVGRAHVNFVLVGITRGGYALAEQKGVSLKEVAKAFMRNVKDLCNRTQFDLDVEETRLLMQWIMPLENGD